MDTFRIFISTDNHVGYKEGDATRKDDSFLALQEVLEHAVETRPDIILLGGDLFHDHVPSMSTMYRTMKLLDTHVKGDCVREFETDNYQGTLNYMKDNDKIRLPIFIIHGNHDDPVAEYTSLELLDLAGLLNYFTHTIDEITGNLIVHPILFTKGTTRVALYGIGNIKDDVCHRLFAENRIQWMQPENSDSYFNLLVVHQNRFKGHGMGGPSKLSIKDDVFPPFIDFVLWGHEHESFSEPRDVPGMPYVILQPGSTVATSIVEPESKPKYVGTLNITQKEYTYNPIKLHNVRPMLFKEITIDQGDVSEAIHSAIEELLESAPKPPDTPFDKPLMRLKIRSTSRNINTFYYKGLYAERAANDDIITITNPRKRNSINNLQEAGEAANQIELTNILSDKLDERALRFNSSKELCFHLDQALNAGKTNALENLFNAKMEHLLKQIEIPEVYDWRQVDKIKNTIDVSGDEVTVTARKRQTSKKIDGSAKKGKFAGTSRNLQDFFDL